MDYLMEMEFVSHKVLLFLNDLNVNLYKKNFQNRNHIKYRIYKHLILQCILKLDDTFITQFK